MEEAEEGNKEQDYDDIKDTEEEKPNRNAEFTISRQQPTAAGEESSATTRTADINSGLTESTGDKKNILHKLRKKFRSRKSSEDLTNQFIGSQEISESLPTYASIEDDVKLPEATNTKRLSLKHMHKTLSFQGFSKTRFAGASQFERSRSKTFSTGIRGEAKPEEGAFVPGEQAAASCVFPSSNTPPPIPSHSSIARKEQWRRHAKSLSMSIGESSVSVSKDHSSNSKCQPSTTPVTKSLETLSHYNWYWGPINRYEAEDVLKGKPDGCFLVRDSSNEFHLYSVSFRSRGRTCHTRILYEDGRFGFLTPTGLMGTTTVVGLIKRSIKISQKGAMCFSKGPSFLDTPRPIQFMTPVSRFDDLPSLQHLCRFVIRQNSRCDKLHELPLPPKLIRYLNVENHFLENK